MRCPVCQGYRIQIAARLQDSQSEEYRALVCRTCGLLFAHPIPDVSFHSLQAIYGAEYTAEMHVLEDSRLNSAIRAATDRQMDIVERYVRPGLALNVGAMNGVIKLLEQRGWRLQIVEVSAHAAEIARELWGLNVTVSRIEDYAGEA